MKDQGEVHPVGSIPSGGGSIIPWDAIKSPKQSEEGHAGIMQPLGDQLPQSAEKPPGRSRSKS